jgi:hypothetical protein
LEPPANPARFIPHQIAVLGAARLLHGRVRALPPHEGRLGIGEIVTERPEVFVRLGEFLDGMPPVRETGDGDQYVSIHVDTARLRGLSHSL